MRVHDGYVAQFLCHLKAIRQSTMKRPAASAKIMNQMCRRVACKHVHWRSNRALSHEKNERERTQLLLFTARPDSSSSCSLRQSSTATTTGRTITCCCCSIVASTLSLCATMLPTVRHACTCDFDPLQHAASFHVCCFKAASACIAHEC